MLRNLLAVFILGMYVQRASSCICMDTPLEEALEYSDAVFVGVIIQSNEGDSLFSVENGAWQGTPYWNLRVLRLHKGLAKTNDLVTVFNDNSDCGGFLTHFAVGDTVVVFANFLSQTPWVSKFLYGGGCNRRYKLPLIKPDPQNKYFWETWQKEMAFLNDTSLWQVPEPTPFFKFDRPASSEKSSAPLSLMRWALLISVFANLVLTGMFLLRKKKTG